MIPFANATRGVAVVVDPSFGDVSVYFTVHHERGTADEEGIYRYHADVFERVVQVSKPGSIVQDPATGTVYVSLPYASTVNTLNLETFELESFAGTGTRGFSGDGGQASAATFSYPWGLAVDSDAGYVYIADTVNNRIRRVDALGVVTTVAGTGTSGYNGDGFAIESQISAPGGLGVGSDGTVYLADTVNSLIRKIEFDETDTGKLTTIAGAHGATLCSCGSGASPPPDCGDGGAALKAVFKFPWGISVSGDNVLVTDTRSCRVRVISTLTDGDDTLVVVNADAGNGAIRGVDADAENATLFLREGIPPNASDVSPPWPPGLDL